jgi:hypothetical protein
MKMIAHQAIGMHSPTRIKTGGEPVKKLTPTRPFPQDVFGNYDSQRHDKGPKSNAAVTTLRVIA